MTEAVRTKAAKRGFETTTNISELHYFFGLWDVCDAVRWECEAQIQKGGVLHQDENARCNWAKGQRTRVVQRSRARGWVTVAGKWGLPVVTPGWPRVRRKNEEGVSRRGVTGLSCHSGWRPALPETENGLVSWLQDRCKAPIERAAVLLQQGGVLLVRRKSCWSGWAWSKGT